MSETIAIGEFPEVIVTPSDDNIIRCMWAAGRRGQDIRQEIGGASIGVIGHRVKAMELPVRDHNLRVLQHRIEGHVHPLLDGDAEEDE